MPIHAPSGWKNNCVSQQRTHGQRQRERQTDRETDRKTERQRDRETDRNIIVFWCDKAHLKLAMSVGRSVGRLVSLSVTHSFDDPYVAPYWPTWPCYALAHVNTKHASV